MQLNRNLAHTVQLNDASGIPMVDDAIPVLLKDYKWHLSASYLGQEAFMDQHAKGKCAS